MILKTELAWTAVSPGTLCNIRQLAKFANRLYPPIAVVSIGYKWRGDCHYRVSATRLIQGKKSEERIDAKDHKGNEWRGGL